MNGLLSAAPILVCAAAGIVYGCSFVLQQRGILFQNGGTSRLAEQLAFFIARVGILFATGRYLLRSTFIPSILGMLAFISMFWAIILAVRMYKHERV